jgi:V-type H+-transporting ATPase subunit a
MTLGILAYGANAKFNNDSVSALLVFPSRLIFFFCTVGYLVFVIILKWLKPWPNPGDAPNVISVLVTMWMTGGSTVRNILFNYILE